MAQPTFINLFGVDAVYNPTTNKFEISKASLETAGITNAAVATPIEILGAITKTAHDWLTTNLDEAVNGASRLDYSAPFFRNNLEKSSFIYNLQFFGNFAQPVFDPDEL